MKILSGTEIADYVKANQARQARSLRARKIQPKLVILRNSNSLVITKYVALKQQYGQDIGVVVEDWLRDDLLAAIAEANADSGTHGIIVQLPLKDTSQTDAITSQIALAKDVDGLVTSSSLYHQTNNAETPIFESATATAINWLLAGYDVKLDSQRIAIVGHGRLVGAPLERMWRNSGYDVAVFRSHSDLQELRNYNVIVSATGVPHLIKSEMISPGAVIVDAGTASEGGILVGDVDDAVRERKDISAITPKIGGVGPLTVTALFEHVLIAAENAQPNN